MIDLEPTEEQKIMVTAVSQLASKLRERTREIEAARGLPADLRQTAFDMGLGGTVAITEAKGGAGLGLVTAVLLEEALAHGDPAAPFALGGPASFATAVSELGSDAQSSDWMARLGSSEKFGAVAWSEPKANKERAGFSTVATLGADGTFQIDGVKSFVMNADRAELLVVFAQVDEAAGWNGIGAFVVERSAEGVQIGERSTTLGLDAVSVCEVRLQNVRVSTSARLDGNEDFHRSLLRFFTKEGLKVAARATGLSQAALDLALEYVSTRKAFGKPIGHFQAVAFTLADRAMEVDAARTMIWRAAALWDSAREGGDERDALLNTAWAISYALETAMRTADDAVQLHGGSGFMRDYLVEKLMRDAKQIQLCVMTGEQADQLAAALELKLPLDPALVLPTPESQAVLT